MNELWHRELIARGARIDAGQVRDFGDPRAECAALAAATTLHPVSDGLLLVEGEDARAFLHSQLTSDIQALPAARAQYSAYCSAKGRMLATFLASGADDRFVLQMPRALVEPIAARLRKYVLRAKVRLSDASDAFALLGIGGPDSGRLVARAVGALPARPLDLAAHAGRVVCALESGCFQVLVPAGRAAETWDALTAGAWPGGEPGWSWRRIEAGIPWVTAATQDLFVPQMADMERLGAVSFAKGCYPGQEIVARAQYRGEVRRRLFRAHTQADALEGQALYAPDAPSQAAGTVCNAAPAPGGGTQLLVVAQVDAAPTGMLRLGGADGPAVRLAPIAIPHPA